MRPVREVRLLVLCAIADFLEILRWGGQRLDFLGRFYLFLNHEQPRYQQRAIAAYRIIAADSSFRSSAI
jgi:hypothetical protein